MERKKKKIIKKMKMKKALKKRNTKVIERNAFERRAVLK